jgi:hypothetical protein
LDLQHIKNNKKWHYYLYYHYYYYYRGVSSVTSKYRTQLIQAYIEPEYMQYLQYRFEWSDATITSIAWKSFKIAVQQIQSNVLVT